MFAFTSKHHEGFSMFDTRTRVKHGSTGLPPGGPKIESCDLAYTIMEDAVSPRHHQGARRRRPQTRHQDRSLFLAS